jgi:hypothetical protein
MRRTTELAKWAWIVIGIEAAVLLGVGMRSHVSDLLRAGWHAYPTMPGWLNLYWDSLAVFDPLAAVLLLLRRSAGVYVAVAVMITDVASNWYSACVISGHDAAHAPGLQRVIAFGLLVLGTAPWLVRELRRAGRTKPNR